MFACSLDAYAYRILGFFRRVRGGYKMINNIWRANERASYNGFPPPCPSVKRQRFGESAMLPMPAILAYAGCLR